eukprot:170529-Chlamydomonas_euryale.AAC.2
MAGQCPQRRPWQDRKVGDAAPRGLGATAAPLLPLPPAPEGRQHESGAVMRRKGRGRGPPVQLQLQLPYN